MRGYRGVGGVEPMDSGAFRHLDFGWLDWLPWVFALAVVGALALGGAALFVLYIFVFSHLQWVW